MTPFVLTLACGALGAVLASFAGVISERLNTGESWMHGRSRCNSCNRALTAPDLVPVVSWLVTRGRCRTCTASIPSRYALTELVLGVVFASSYIAFGLDPILPVLLLCWFILTIIVLYDLRHTVVPMSLSFGFLIVAGAFAVLSQDSVHALGATCLTAGIIGLGFVLLHAISGGKWMGLGDAPIALGLSLIAGTHAVSGLLFSFWIGAAIGILILVATPKGHRMGIEVPFVPFLAAGYLLAFFTQWNPFIQ